MNTRDNTLDHRDEKKKKNLEGKKKNHQTAFSAQHSRTARRTPLLTAGRPQLQPAAPVARLGQRPCSQESPPTYARQREQQPQQHPSNRHDRLTRPGGRCIRRRQPPPHPKGTEPQIPRGTNQQHLVLPWWISSPKAPHFCTPRMNCSLNVHPYHFNGAF